MRDEPDGGAPTWTWILFSVHGRLPRYLLWFFGVFWSFAAGLGTWVLIGSNYVIDTVGGRGTVPGEVKAVIVAVAIAVFLWGVAALTVKRLHDRGKSAWWLVVFWLVPVATDVAGRFLMGRWSVLFDGITIVFMIWNVVELNFLRGTIGPNRFGDDPVTDDGSWSVEMVASDRSTPQNG